MKTDAYLAAAELAPVVEEECPSAGRPAAAASKLSVARVLREIFESDLRPIPPLVAAPSAASPALLSIFVSNPRRFVGASSSPPALAIEKVLRLRRTAGIGNCRGERLQTRFLL